MVQPWLVACKQEGCSQHDIRKEVQPITVGDGLHAFPSLVICDECGYAVIRQR